MANKEIRKKIPAKANIRNPKYQEVTKKVNTKKEVVVNKEINNDEFFGLNQKQIKEAKNIEEDTSIESSIMNAKVSITGKFSSEVK